VYVLEPSEKETLQILQGLAERYERHHHCCYDDEALEAAVKLSHTYIADRFLPDKVRCHQSHKRVRSSSACMSLASTLCWWHAHTRVHVLLFRGRAGVVLTAHVIRCCVAGY
jgi:hypothetical protein